MKSVLLFLGILILSPVAFSQTTWYVPDDFPTIQGAIDGSVNGDTVIVRPGSYVENIDYGGKAVTVESELGASMTTIDGGRNGSVVVFQTGEGGDSVLNGFTVTNGDAYYGGGIYSSSSSPVIRNNTIKGNTAEKRGGGIYSYDSSSMVIMNNTIKLNLTWNGTGGGIDCLSSSLVIVDNTILENTAYSEGGGIYYKGSSVPIVNNTILNNTGNSGGGIYCYDSGPNIEYNTISYNTASSGCGGGIYCRSSPFITNNFIAGNLADYGGGICCSSSGPTITNNTISDNAAYHGGGICCDDSFPTFKNNTISMNMGGSGGGIKCYGSFPTITNTIFWANNATTGPEIWIGWGWWGSSTVTISYSNVDGGESSVYVEAGCTLSVGAGNIDANPIFMNPANGDFHLTWNSPCLSAGDNTVVTDPYDFEHDPRIAFGNVDMGADEYYYHLYHTGEVLPGAPIDMKVVGFPGADVTLFLGSGTQSQPISTQHGYFWLNWPPLWYGNLGTVPGNGVLVFPANVPSGWATGSEHPLQALIGKWGVQNTQLSNLLILEVE